MINKGGNIHMLWASKVQPSNLFRKMFKVEACKNKCEVLKCLGWQEWKLCWGNDGIGARKGEIRQYPEEPWVSS